MSMRVLASSVLASFAGVLFTSMAVAQAWPARPIKVVVPFPPGGGADTTARLVSGKLAEALGQPFVIENKPGANGSTGTDSVAKSPGDGYTLVVTDRGAFGINPSIYAKLPYDSVKDFEHVAIVTYGNYVLAVNKDVPAKNFDEFLKLAKAKPGSINYGSIGIGSITHFSFEALKSKFGVDLVHVPYRGTAPAAAAAVSGEVQVTMATAPSIIGHIREGRLRAIALGANKRSALLPDVPAMTELGGTADSPLAPGWFGFSAPAGTPRPVVMRLAEEIHKAMKLPEIANRLGGVGLDVNVATAPDKLPSEMAESIRKDVPYFAGLVKQIGVKPE